jgi:transcriptional regulator with GAF, ATPase, and Fis domain
LDPYSSSSQSGISDARNRILGELFKSLPQFRKEQELVDAIAPIAIELIGCKTVRWYRQDSRNWKLVGGVGLGGATPLADLLNQPFEAQVVSGKESWAIFGAEPTSLDRTNEFLVVGWDASSASLNVAICRVVAEAIRDALAVLRDRSKLGLRANLLGMLLGEASAWHLHRDTPQMLEQIAKLLAEALGADRASLFIWDKVARELVGHPALGVDGGALRIPDNSGLVGVVLKSNRPRRWDSGDPESEINRGVDKQTGYKTKSLVAVPLLGSRGVAIGVLELLNHRSGMFSLDDEQLLMEMSNPISMIVEGVQAIEGLTRSRDHWVSAEQSRAQIVGTSKEIETVKVMLERVARTDLAVMILGENGTGKEVVARSIHLQSERRSEPFVAVNCAAIAESLLESELFGHEKGAFTDAVATREGKFEIASGGTLFLDEIGDMSLNGQSKLLRVLEEKMVVRVGGSTPISIDVRILAATNRDLNELVAAKKFREDLFFRLNVVSLRLPALRQRGPDILLLADFFLEEFCRKAGRAKPSFSPEAHAKLLGYSWPGNVRELRNMMERLAYLHSGSQVEVGDLDFLLTPILGFDKSKTSSAIDLDLNLSEATDRFQVEVIETHIKAADGNMSQAADSLGLHRSNLYRKMKNLGMDPPK